MFILPDFPDSTRWLTEEERRLALRRMKEDVGVGDQGETETGGRAYGLYLAVTDWKFRSCDDSASRCIIVQCLLPNAERHTWLQSYGDPPAGCTSLHFHCDLGIVVI